MKRPTILRSADTDSGAAPDPATNGDSGKPTRLRQADHYLIGPDGAEVEDEELASGIGWKHMGLDASEAFVYQLPGATVGTALTMWALFGAKTGATNEASQVRNNPKGAGSPAEQLAAVKARFALVESGKWLERAPGDRAGARIDPDILADVYCTFAEGEDGRVRDRAAIADVLRNDKVKRAEVHSIPQVKVEYVKRTTTARASLDVNKVLEGL